VACNVITRPGEPTNLLPEIAQRWFGRNAGAPGTDHVVAYVAPEGAPRAELRPGRGA
jgi:hypothetical protein